MTTIDNPKVDNSCFKFYCDLCNYGTSKKSSMNKHLSTTKHIKTTCNNGKVVKSCSTGYSCNICEKPFNDRAGLWRHTKKCRPAIDASNNFVIDKELVMLLIKENSELKNMMMEVIKTGTHNTNTTNNTNSHNKTFNLQFFLNETCKNAMNIMDFVSQLQVGIKDLEETGR